MSKSKAQKFAQKRNTSGGTLKGILVNLKNNVKRVSTQDEAYDLDKAIYLLEQVHDTWQDNYEEAKREHI